MVSMAMESYNQLKFLNNKRCIKAVFDAIKMVAKKILVFGKII